MSVEYEIFEASKRNDLKKVRDLLDAGKKICKIIKYVFKYLFIIDFSIHDFEFFALLKNAIFAFLLIF